MINFITTSDKTYLSEKGINCDIDIPIFVREMRDYFYKNWREEYFSQLKQLDDGNIESLNNILEYPSTTGYMILDSSFTGGISIDNICSKSKLILSYF